MTLPKLSPILMGMRYVLVFPVLTVSLFAGCALLPAKQSQDPAVDIEAPVADQAALPEEAGEAPPDEGNLRPADPVGAGALITVASLGDPTKPGLWLETPLVASERGGRITAPNGTSTPVTLIPIDGPTTAGSRISLAAIQALGFSPADLVEVEVISES
ncbi:MAG: hypothetical protein AB8B51_16685 [Sedimentitalea sp.]